MNELNRNTSPQLSQYIRKYLMYIGEKEGFIDCNLVEHPGDSNNNEGFIGDMVRVSLHGNRHGSKCELKLICKILKSDRGNIGPLLFAREAYVYQKVLKEFRNFQKRHELSDVNKFKHFPKCYGAETNIDDNQYFIVLEDLLPSGYSMANRFISMDFEHVKELIETLGRLHAISFAMKEKEPKLFDQFTNLDDQLRSHLSESEIMQEAYIYNFNKALDAFESDRVKEIQIITYLRDNFSNILLTFINSQQDDKYNVIIHGDLWVNNILFAKDVENKLNSCLVDFQMSYYGSPAVDLCYLLFTSTDKKFRDMHFVDVLKLYHESLTNTLHGFGCEAKQLFSFDNLLDEVKKFAKLAIIYAPLLVRIITARKNDNSENTKPDSNDFVLNYLNLCNDKTSLEHFNERIREVFEDGIMYGYI